MSRGAKLYIPERHIKESLNRHQSGDYGIEAVDAWERNDRVTQYTDLDFNFVTSCYDFVPPVGDVHRYTICTNFDRKEIEIQMYDEW